MARSDNESLVAQAYSFSVRIMSGMSVARTPGLWTVCLGMGGNLPHQYDVIAGIHAAIVRTSRV